MSFAGIRGELIFPGNASDANLKTYFPESIMGLFVELTVYVEYSAGAAAGKVQIQTAYPSRTASNLRYNGVWGNVGSTIDWAVEASQKYASVSGVFADLRLNIDTAVTTGTVRAFFVAAPH
jgi:hypothetical protein